MTLNNYKSILFYVDLHKKHPITHEKNTYFRPSV
jgi:hypothetical protein